MAASIETGPGRLEFRDFDCVRNGISSLLMFFAPLKNRRRVDAADRRAKLDRAGQTGKLADDDFPGGSAAPVMGNPDNHGTTSLFEASVQEEARRIKSRISVVYAPKHGSWPEMAEFEIGAVSRRRLRRRVPYQTFMKRRWPHGGTIETPRTRRRSGSSPPWMRGSS